MTMETKTCETCEGSRMVPYHFDRMVPAPEALHGHVTKSVTERIDCPDCAFRCEECMAPIWELEARGDVPLRNYMKTEHWCGPKCFKEWIDRHGYIKPQDIWLRTRVAKDVYQDQCGCDFGDDSHSNGCHAIVDALNDLIGAAFERANAKATGSAAS